MQEKPVRFHRGPLSDPRRDRPAGRTLPHRVPDQSQYVSITMEFRCNLRCEHCMIEGTMDWLEPQTRERFDEILTFNREHARWSGLILTGSEITLKKDLPELAVRARQSGFRHVRIQTHGMALARQDYCDMLVEAGVNEFFVSVSGHDPASHDAITGVPGSFEKTLRGLENLERHSGVISITNTVVTVRNHRTLARVVKSLGHLRRLAQMEFWFYWPMRETDERSLIVPLRDALPPLRDAIGLAHGAGRSVEIKNLPHCLLEEHASLLVNDQPPLIIDDRFWGEFQRNGFHECVHRERCRSEQCLGLNAAYVARFGWEQELLRPVDAEGHPLSESGS